MPSVLNGDETALTFPIFLVSFQPFFAVESIERWYSPSIFMYEETMVAKRKRAVCFFLLCSVSLMWAGPIAHGQESGGRDAPVATKSKIILDTDIGDDIDDAFALALAMRSPEVEIVGITTAWGNTELRARLAQRFVQENGVPAIPIAVGVATESKAAFSQARWAQDGEEFHKHMDAVDFLLEQAKKAPGEIT